MEDFYANVKSVHPKPSTHSTDPRQCFMAVIVCLGLLSVFLLVGLVALVFHYQFSVRDSAAEFSAIKNNLTERLQVSDDKLSSMTEERDRLSANLTAKMDELDRLQTLYKRLPEKTCPPGWTMFGCTCYFVSSRSGSWDEGREDCRGRGADLVVINSHEEQAFLASSTSEYIWIGLTDRDEEGTWKWIDGTPLTLKFWGKNLPDGSSGKWGEEDCVHIRTDIYTTWNDLSCTAQMKWVCEKQLC